MCVLYMIEFSLILKLCPESRWTTHIIVGLHCAVFSTILSMIRWKFVRCTVQMMAVIRFQSLYLARKFQRTDTTLDQHMRQ